MSYSVNIEQFLTKFLADLQRFHNSPLVIHPLVSFNDIVFEVAPEQNQTHKKDRRRVPPLWHQMCPNKNNIPFKRGLLIDQVSLPWFLPLRDYGFQRDRSRNREMLGHNKSIFAVRP